MQYIYADFFLQNNYPLYFSFLLRSIFFTGSPYSSDAAVTGRFILGPFFSSACISASMTQVTPTDFGIISTQPASQCGLFPGSRSIFLTTERTFLSGYTSVCVKFISLLHCPLAALLVVSHTEILGVINDFSTPCL